MHDGTRGSGDLWKIIPLIIIGLLAFVVIGIVKGVQAGLGGMFSSGKGFLIGFAILAGLAVVCWIGGLSDGGDPPGPDASRHVPS